MTSLLLPIIAIVLVAALAFLLRGRNETVSPPDTRPSSDPSGSGPADDPEDAADDPDEEDGTRDFRVSVTSEGLALIPAGRQVLMLDLSESPGSSDWLKEGIEDGSVPYQVLNRLYGFSARGSNVLGGAPALGAGDFTGLRTRRDPSGGWLVETLGRDGEYGSMHFASEAAASGVVAEFERLQIVQQTLDEHGDRVPASAEDFEEARRLAEETERHLAIDPDEDEPPPRNDWSSRR